MENKTANFAVEQKLIEHKLNKIQLQSEIAQTFNSISRTSIQITKSQTVFYYLFRQVNSNLKHQQSFTSICCWKVFCMLFIGWWKLCAGM
jgi:hypothetical protein